MTKTKTQPAIEERLELARRLRDEAQAACEKRQGSRPPRRPADLSALRRSREKARERFRRQATRGNLPGNRTAELAATFNDAELADLLAQDAEAREAKAARNAQLREGREVAALAGQIEREREQGARHAAEAEARERLGVKV